MKFETFILRTPQTSTTTQWRWIEQGPVVWLNSKLINMFETDIAMRVLSRKDYKFYQRCLRAMKREQEPTE